MNITILQAQWYDGIVATSLNREEITALILSKMYNAALDENSTVSFSGYLYSPTGSWAKALYLMELFNGLTIDIPTAGRYITFEDPEVENYFLHTYNSGNGIGDGVGITSLNLLSITLLTDSFFLNTSITSLNDLLYFTSLTSINGRFARDATNLVSVKTPSSLINLSNPQNSDAAFMGAFCDCSKLSSVTLNEGLTTIMCKAFSGCTSLLTIHIPNSVIYLGHGTETDTRKGVQVFGGCSALQTITGGANVIQLGGATFYNCDQLSSIGNIDLSLVNFIGGDCFFNCQNLELGSVSNSYITSIPTGGMFFRCKKLTSINFPNVTSIGDAASWQGFGNFRECSALTSVTLSPNLTTIGSYAFCDCTSLANIGNVSPTSVGTRSFYNCPITAIDLSNCTSVGEEAFRECSLLGTNQDLDLNLDTITIGSGCFNGTAYKTVTLHETTKHSIGGSTSPSIGPSMSSLTTLDLSDTKLTDAATRYYNNTLTTLILPETVTNVHYEIASRDTGTNITYIILLSSSVPSYGYDSTWSFFGGNGYGSTTPCKFYVLDSLYSSYTSDTNWSQVPSSRLRPLSELPAGVWKTGLYQLYEPYLSHSSDPAYATT